MSTLRQFLLVICGPPCSGKSALFEALKLSKPALRYFEMDEIRMRIMPGNLHDKPRRTAAYRIMHFWAGRELSQGHSVVVCATYIPHEQRAELVALAARRRVRLFVAQCLCSPEDATKRFLHRSPTHAGADLTATRVKEISEQYERYEGALLINTHTYSDQLQLLTQYLAGDRPVDPIQWARHEYLRRQNVGGRLASESPKLSEAAVRAAWRRMWGIRSLIALTVLAWLAGVAMPLLKLFEYLRPLEVLAWEVGRGMLDTMKEILLFTLSGFLQGDLDHSLTDTVTWATFVVIAGGLWGLLLQYLRDLRNVYTNVRTIQTAGDTPRYNLLHGNPPGDVETYFSYAMRLSDRADERRMPIPNVPLFFAILPERSQSFSVEGRRARRHASQTIEDEAAEFGLDWNGFVDWQKKARRAEYPITYSHEYSARCTSLAYDRSRGICRVTCNKSSYDDFVCRELAVNYCSAGNLPDMRRLLEGTAWDEGGEALRESLTSVPESAKRYSMRISVTGLVLTRDDYFILQRRSAAVGHGLGSLAASVNGGSDYYADASGILSSLLGAPLCWTYAHSHYSLHRFLQGLDLLGPRKWNFSKSALRELGEEVGIGKNRIVRTEQMDSTVAHYSRPFIGASYNLRYGRDLNFYCCFRTDLSARDLASRRRRARDSWEVESLVLLSKRDVTVKGIVSGAIDDLVPGRARHLLGALYSWAVYSGQDG